MIPSSRNAPPRPSAVPASQNTAPVAEFRCLFTHDVRRKQKRWQDGFLKFHTFNNRVMVYDESRNFLGDTYYKDSDQLVEGDELRLDKGVMVQVEEAMGITQTDLTPLFEKRTAESPARPTPSRPTPSVHAKPFQRPTSVLPNSIPRLNSQLRHKSLNTLLGGSRTPMGKAVPMQSPYEVRQEKENGVSEERAPKRQKLAPQPPCVAAAKPLQEIAIPSEQSVSRMVEPRSARKTHVPATPKAQPSPIINLDSEPEMDDAFMSDVTLPNDSPKLQKSIPPTAINPVVEKVIAKPVLVVPPEPANQHITAKAKLARRLKPVPRKTAVKAVETPQKPAPPSSPPVSASDRIKNIDFAMSARKEVHKAPSPAPVLPPSPRIKAKTKTKSLRLSVGVKRGTLLCQTTAQQSKTMEKVSGTKEKKRRSREVEAVQAPTDKEVTTAQKATTHSKPTGDRRSYPSKDEGGFTQLVAGSAFADDIMLSPFDAPFDISEDPEVVLGTMDQQVMSLPVPGRTSAVRTDANRPLETSLPRRKQTKSSVKNTDTVPSHGLQTLKSNSIVPSESASRDVSPGTDTGTSTTWKRSIVASNKKAPSAGGFQKKLKRTQKKAEAREAAPVQDDAQSVVEETPEPPEVPSNKRNINTETAQPQQKSKRLKPVTPVDSTTALSSPNRSFRRVRSENDARVPSSADDWEKRNTSKSSKNDDVPAPTTNMLHPPFKKSSGLAALTRKTDPRKKFLRTQSLSLDTVAAAKTVAVAAQIELKSPVIDTDVGPWSTEAFDLFDWRPPER